MPTVEERLAALEKQMAAWIDQQPTTYYTHQYSGEEIDESVGVTQDTVPTLVRPNLLDNWYFGRPVDQRGGMLQLAGTMLYSDAACTQAMFPSTKTTSIIKVSDIAAHPSDDSTVYVKLADCVRGYTGNGYTVDRWKLTYGNGQISIKDEQVSLLGSGMNFSQILDENVYKPLRGKTVTLSIIGRGDCQIVSEDAPSSYHAAFINSDVFTLASFSFLTKSDSDRFMFHIKPNTSNPVDVLAAKLELGPTQTLAHQENGVWVMNEVPDYGEQLRRCQMDLFKIGDAVRYCSLGNGVARDSQFVSITIPTPVTMRTMPVLIAPPVGFAMRHNDTIVSGGASFSVDAFSQNSIMLKVQSQVALTPGDMWEAFLQPGGSLVFSAEL